MVWKVTENDGLILYLSSLKAQLRHLEEMCFVPITAQRQQHTVALTL